MTQEIIQDFSDGLYKYLKKAVEGDAQYYDNNIHASGLDGCVRKCVYSYFNFPKRDRDMAELIQLQVGNLCHSMIQDAILQNDKFIILGIELKVSAGLPEGISGKLDIIVEHKATGKISLWDIKSVRPNAFKFGDLIKPSYKVQVNVYRKGWEMMYGKTIDNMYVFILDRSGTNMPFIGEVEEIDDRDLDIRFAKYGNAVAKYNSSEELPPMIEYEIDVKPGKLNSTILLGYTNWECGYCQYQGITCPVKMFDKKNKEEVGSIDANGVVKINNNTFKSAIEKKVREYIG